MDDIGRDPNFRSQYDCGVTEDPEFEAAISGSPQPRLTLPAVTQPLAQQSIQPFVRLR